ncbi:MAG: hypothetical protein V3R64_08725, partial [Sphingomonadales bacterium]
MTTPGDKRRDLTRWNRRGLERFQYIDGDAANWLEELRLSHLSQFLRDIENDPRKPQFWRDIFSLPKGQWPLQADQQTLKKALSWEDLWQDFPDESETLKKRNERLLGRYHKTKSDQTFEISRAFARAAHVLMGYTNAYANEGYIRTATQWDNLKKLATMVGYFPAPAASATTIVGLTTKGDVRFETVPPGLGMKHSPSEGGAPVIFETLEELTVHEDLNALRALDWDKNPDPQDLTKPSTWLADGYKEDLSVGDIVVVLDKSTQAQSPNLLSTVEAVEDSEGAIQKYSLEFDSHPWFLPKATDARLLIGYPKPRRGLLQLTGSDTQMVVEVSSAAQFMEGNIVVVKDPDLTSGVYAAIEKLVGNRLLLKGIGLPFNVGPIEISPLTEYAVTNDNENVLPEGVPELMYIGSSGAIITEPGTPFSVKTATNYRYNFLTPPIRKAFAPVNNQDSIFTNARVVDDPGDFIEFDGSPPEGLASGSWLVADPEGSTTFMALKVESICEGDKTHSISFLNITGLDGFDPSEILFYGPFAKTLKLENNTWNTTAAIDLVNGTVLEIEGPEAGPLLKTKRKVLVENQETKKSVVAVIAEPPSQIPDEPKQVTVFFEANPELETGFPKYQTVFRANALKVSHGETKPRKTLGSGNGEKPAQTFHFDETEITFVPDPSSETGVRPDIDVEVGGVIWTWVGSILEAEQQLKTYTTTIREDGTLDVRFLTRLPTGSDNIVAARYRVGTGPSGNLVPSYSFSKPLKSSAFVKEIHQPLVPSGGAGREPVSAMRTNAPAHLKALGRAVSCADFA